MYVLRQMVPRSRPTILCSIFTATLLAASVLPMLAGPTPADADINNTRADAWGTLEVAGSNANNLGGTGVDIYSNGSQVTYTPNKPNNTVNGVVSGEEWQCVELVNRLYLTKGWTTSTWTGDGGQLYGSAPNVGLTNEELNGSITYLNPGDVLVLQDSGAGHAALINTYNSSTGAIQIESQNTPQVYDSTFSLSNKTISSTGWGTYTVKGIVHHPTGSGSSSHDLDQFYVYDGAWNMYDVTNATQTQIAGDPYEDSGGGVWARDINNHLRQFYMSGSSWTAFDVSNATGANIASDVSAGSSGEVARGTNGHLYQFYVNGSGAWTAFDISNATTVNISGDPFEDSGGGIWARDTNNHLRQFYVANGSWTAFDVSAATTVNIASDPSVGAGGIFADDTSNHLRQFYVSNGSWTAANLSGATGVNVAGNPVQDSGGGIWIRDVNNHYRQFYVSNGLWVAFDVSGATTVNITGDPGIGSGGNFAEDTNGHLRQFYVSNGSWVAADITSASGGYSVHTNPVSGSGGEFAGS